MSASRSATLAAAELPAARRTTGAGGKVAHPALAFFPLCLPTVLPYGANCSRLLTNVGKSQENRRWEGSFCAKLPAEPTSATPHITQERIRAGVLPFPPRGAGLATRAPALSALLRVVSDSLSTGCPSPHERVCQLQL
jgi:hypothetical protein